MKTLKIERGNGHFLAVDGGYVEIDKLNKEHLLHLISLTLDTDVEYDPYDEATLQNQAHRVIYKNIASKLDELVRRRQEYKDESATLYQTVYDRYRQDN